MYNTCDRVTIEEARSASKINIVVEVIQLSYGGQSERTLLKRCALPKLWPAMVQCVKTHVNGKPTSFVVVALSA